MNAQRAALMSMGESVNDRWPLLPPSKAWEDVFLTLAIPRARPLWSEAGVPKPFVIHPGPLHAIATQFIERWQALPATDPGWERLIVDAFGQLRTAYGDAATGDLVAWGVRTTVDSDQSAWWMGWTLLFPELADVWGHGARPLVEPALPPARLRAVEQTIRERLDLADHDRLEALVEAANSEPRSAEEDRLMRYEDPLDGSVLFDPVLHLQGCVTAERGFEIWRALERILSPAEIDALIAWGQAERVAFAERNHLPIFPPSFTRPR